MNARSSGHAAIQQCLQEEVSIMTSLADLLKQEQSALIESDVVQLNDFTQSKGQLVIKMTELEKKRNSFLSDLGFNTDLEGMQAYLAQAAQVGDAAIDTQDSARHWDALLELTVQAKEDNRTNGSLINRRLSLNQATLNLLQQNTNQAGSMYGPNGQSTVKSTPGKGYIAT
ncbi:flagella synthesis protein FlgN [Undibacterium sp. Ji42W]|uniref:flagella synthesis protein FlgN n=1 Tax=Undibacterium sp. Ji42W TaxID=3413039 RepID=UPI003BF38BD5